MTPLQDVKVLVRSVRRNCAEEGGLAELDTAGVPAVGRI